MNRPLRQQGAALVVVLSILVLLTILVVGLTVAMRLERSASFYDRERSRADFLVRMGIDHGQALLMDATATNRFWVSSPGRVAASAPGTFAELSESIVLSSGYTDNTNSDVSTDLNQSALIGSDRVLDPNGPALRVRWIYVQDDGGFSETMTARSVGRFAFWVDDESTRVNLNTASKRTVTQPDSWPSQIELGALPWLDTHASAIASAASNAPFLTPLDALGRNPDWTNALAANRFLVTHYSQDPDINPWGEPRMMLTTRQSESRGRPYLQITGFPSGDPGLRASLSPGELQNTFVKLTALLTRADWPYAKGGSFVTKFGTSGVSQMALDLIEYVRTGESTNLWPEPIVAHLSTNAITLLPAATAVDDPALANASIGTVRRPMFSQVGLFCSTNTNASGFVGTLHAQLYLPPGYNAGTNTFSGWSLWSRISSSGGGGEISTTTGLSPVTFTNGYASVAVTNFTIPSVLPGAVPTNSQVRLALLKSSAPTLENILDVAPLDSGTGITLPTQADQTVYAAVNDPRMNKWPDHWAVVTNLPGDVPPPAHLPNHAAYSGVPASDGSAESVHFPAPGSGVRSVGELGYVATGLASSPPAPWRSLRLRRNSSAATNVPPDWALLDLFSAPVPERFVPGTNVTAGRINLNTFIQDGSNSVRTNVLNALFAGVMTNAFADVVGRVGQVTLPAAGNYGRAADFTNFVSVGQLAEIEGIGDQGEAGEAVLRKVASVATTRSGVFSIYSKAQTIQVVNGRAVVNGEKMVRAMVERYFDGNEVRFRIIHWSQIYP
jgi:Type II secretory pathway, component PulK